MNKKLIRRAAALLCAAVMFAPTTSCVIRNVLTDSVSTTAGTSETSETAEISTDSPAPASEKTNVTSKEVIESETDAVIPDTSEETTAASAPIETQDTAPAYTTTAQSEAHTETPTQTETKKETYTETLAQTEKQPESSTAPATEKAPLKDVELIVSSANGWNDGTADYSQLDGTIRNNGGVPVDNWTAVITVGSSASVDQSWNCDITMKNGVMTVTPADYNRNIPAGGEVTFGLILKNPGKIDTEKSKLNCSAGTYSASDGGSGGNNGNNNNSGSGGTPPPPPVSTKDVPKPTTDDWLYVKGNKIVDKNGKEVWITGINWFGYNTGTNTFDGLWACDLNTSLAQIADHGFNLLRLPISAELINNWASGNYPTANFNQATNSYLVGMNSLEIFDYVIGQCRANGLKIMIDIHSAKTDASGHMKNVWYDGNVTEKDYLAALSWMADRYKNDDTILAYDLKNEPHGKPNESPRAKWDNSTDPDNWKYIAEKAAKAVLDKNPNVLVMVEGIEIYPTDIKKNGNFASKDSKDYYYNWWGGNLRGVKDNPVNLGKYSNKLVYSPHDYGPTVYEQPWFKGDYSYKSLYDDVWYDNWLYIHETKTAPLLIGEWGGYMRQPNLKWMTYLRQLIKEKKLHHTFWCFNANSGDTGGLVKDDFTTWDTEKYEFVKEVLWQEGGKFVGLDHEIPLGKNGKALGK